MSKFDIAKKYRNSNNAFAKAIEVNIRFHEDKFGKGDAQAFKVFWSKFVSAREEILPLMDGEGKDADVKKCEALAARWLVCEKRETTDKDGNKKELSPRWSVKDGVKFSLDIATKKAVRRIGAAVERYSAQARKAAVAQWKSMDYSEEKTETKSSK